MTTNAIEPPIDYVEDGVTLSHPIPFKFLANTDLVVSRITGGVETALAYGADFSATGAGDADGGVLTKVSAGTAGVLLRIGRRTARTQSIVYEANDTFPAESHEGALDRLTLIAQEQDSATADLNVRAVRVPPGVEAPPLDIAAFAGKAIGVAADAGSFVPLELDGGGGVSALASLAAPAGAALVGFLKAGTGAVMRTVYQILDDLDVNYMHYGADGGGGVDDSAALMRAVNANKGKRIVIPHNRTCLAAGTILSGVTYNGTTIIVKGEYKLLPCVPFAENFQGAVFAGIVFHDCEDCSLEAPGMFDGNRANQDASQQRHLVYVAGARNLRIGDVKCREIRGDFIVLHRATLAATTDVDITGDNARGIVIGNITGYNSADDGRNLISLISCEDVTIGNISSTGIGGTIGAERMPGGFDAESDAAHGHRIRHVTIGDVRVRTAGTSGFALIGHPLTNDGNRDWGMEDISFGSVTVVSTGALGLGGAPIIRRARGVSGTLKFHSLIARNAGIDIDYADYVDLVCHARGVSVGVTAGFHNYVNKSKIDVQVEDHSAAGLLSVGVNDTIFTGQVFGGQGAGSYGYQIAPGPRATTFTASIAPTAGPTPPTMTVTAVAANGFVGLGVTLSGAGVTGGTAIVRQLTSAEPAGAEGGKGTYEVSISQTTASTVITSTMPAQLGVIYSIHVPYDVGNSFGMQTSVGVSFGAGTAVRDCAFAGYPTFANQFGLDVFIPARNVEGRHSAAAIPALGYWTQGEIVYSSAVAAAGVPGWACTTSGAPGAFVFKPLANVGA